jgi:hypothetical protein
MASNEINDIEFIEKSAEEKTNIKSICQACSHFSIISVMHDSNVVEDGEVKTTQVEYLNPTCTTSNKILIFSQLKKMDSCPENLW